ncbi:hypothetical protein CR513_16563, partial [Mucuna pruriens]
MDPLKCHIPPFDGTGDVETYLDWEMKVDQDSKSIEEYHRDMEVALSRTNVLESNEAIMTRFLHGLNRDRQDMVVLSQYSSMDDLVHQVGEESQEGEPITTGQKEEGKLPNLVPMPKSNNIKCFKCLGKGHIALHCPNKRSMVMKEDGTMDGASSKFESLSISEFDASNEYLLDEEGDLLVVRCLMDSQVVEEDAS